MAGIRMSTLQLNATINKLHGSGNGRGVIAENLNKKVETAVREKLNKEGVKTEQQSVSVGNKEQGDIKTYIKNAVDMKDYEKVAKLAGVNNILSVFNNKGMSLFKTSV